VEDKGIGISKEMLPRVFDMFSRGSKDYEGTGIGLALVRKVVQRMGGKVGVESEEGKGAGFGSSWAAATPRISWKDPAF
jgi:signal transduction histidine kinase